MARSKRNTRGKKQDIFKLLPWTLGVAYRGSSLVCYSVTYLEYKSPRRVVYAIPMSHISDIHELATGFYYYWPIIIFQKLRLIFMGNLMLPQLRWRLAE